MKLCWFQLFLFILAPKLTYLSGAEWLPYHLDGNPCEEPFWNQWHSLKLENIKDSLDHVCKCHSDKCVYMATFKQVPVYWAYQIHHENSTILLDQELVKDFWTWYISPKDIGEILQRKISGSQGTVGRMSFPITHIVSGVVPAMKKHMISKRNWPNKGSSQWIAYNHTGMSGVTFEGAAIRDGNQSKIWSVSQLAKRLSQTYSPTRLVRKHAGFPKVSKNILEINPKVARKAPSERLVVGEMLHNKEIAETKLQQSGQEQEDTSKIGQDDMDGSKRHSDSQLEIIGEVLGTSIPDGSWLRHIDNSTKDSMNGTEDLTNFESSEEKAKQFLGTLDERLSSQKVRAKQVELSSFKSDEITIELTAEEPELIEYNNDMTSPPMLTNVKIPQGLNITLLTVAPHREHTDNTMTKTSVTVNKLIDYSETTIEGQLTPKLLDMESTTGTNIPGTRKGGTSAQLTAHEANTIPKTTKTPEGLPHMTTQSECTESDLTVEPSSEDPNRWPCYGLIHRCPTAFKQCFRKMKAWLKLQKRRPHLTITARPDNSSTDSNSRSQKVSKSQPLSKTVGSRKDFEQNTSYPKLLKDEDNEHFYYFDGKLRIRSNHSGPKADVK